jgi:hypothetical protein
LVPDCVRQSRRSRDHAGFARAKRAERESFAVLDLSRDMCEIQKCGVFTSADLERFGIRAVLICSGTVAKRAFGDSPQANQRAKRAGSLEERPPNARNVGNSQSLIYHGIVTN